MYKFWCGNTEHANKPQFYFGNEKDMECPGCGQKLKLLGETSHQFARISSMNTQQKQQYFLKRSSEHTRTNGELKDRKRQLEEQLPNVR